MYKKDKAPMDWAPQDPVAEEWNVVLNNMEKRSPAQVVNQRGALLTFLMDVPKGGELELQDG